MVRAKFTITSIKEFKWSSDKEVELQPQYDTSIPEDQSFSKATPSGQLTMYVSNPAALAELTLGRTFYLDFVPVDDGPGSTS